MVSRLALEWGSTELVNGIVGHAWNSVSSCLVGLVIAGLLLVQKGPIRQRSNEAFQVNLLSFKARIRDLAGANALFDQSIASSSIVSAATTTSSKNLSTLMHSRGSDC